MNPEFRTNLEYFLATVGYNNTEDSFLEPLPTSQFCRVGISNMKDTGFGLFAKCYIPKGTVICKYSGDTLKTVDALR